MSDEQAPVRRRAGLSTTPRTGTAGSAVTPAAASDALPPDSATAERPRGSLRRRLTTAAIVTVGLVALAAIVVPVARWALTLDGVAAFVADYPGEVPLPAGTPVGIPGWVGWQHFFNVFLMVLIVRSGWLVRTTKRPTAFWTRTVGPKTATARRISLDLWLHLSLDVLWLVNGIIFVVVLIASGRWVRIVPTSWEVVPHALSAALQYAAMDWPTENGWVHYNALQLVAYFVTVFIAAPLAAVTGLRMSGAWPREATRLNRRLPIEWARAVHFPVMLYFVLFTVVHVTLVLATGALRNLNHIFTARDVSDGWGVALFAGSLLLIAGAVAAARPFLVAPVASLTGKVTGR